MKKLMFILAVVVISTACEPMQPSASQANSDVTAMTFVKHPNGLCFGVVRFTTYAGYAGASITNVPERACQP